MKKYFGLLLLFLIIIGVGLLLLINFNIIKLPGSIKAESISLSQNEIGIKLKKEYQLYSFIYPSKASGVKVIYESSNPNIIEVNNVTGYIKAKKLGTATVTAKLESDEKIIDSCLVYVLKENVLTEKLISNVKEVNLESGDIFQLKYQISPNNATVHDVEFVSSDKSIAYVNELGQIKGNNSGKAIISINEKTSGVKEDIIVNVYGEENKKTVKERIEVDTDDVTLNIGGSYELSVKVLPEEANQELTYRSLNDSIATISEDGVIEGKGKGETKVIIRSVTSEEKVVKVKVQEEVVKLEKIRASERNITIKEGEKKKINITFSPNNATNKGINWISENTEVATVSNGTIYGVSSGNTIIKAISEDGNYEERITVKVNKIESSISLKDIKLDKTNVNIKVGESANIKVSYEPENATNKNISWTSSNESIATVKNGLIVGKRQGSCEIYVKSISSGITKTIKVNVSNIEVSKIELDESNITIEVGESDILVKTIIPSNATDKNVTWVSSDTSIVRVNNGTITGEKVGTAIVTARTSNGKEAKCSVKVTAKKTVIEEVEVKKIVLDKESATLNEGEKVKLTATIVPSNAKNKQVTWTSSDTSKATVSNGEVIAKRVGNVTITAKSSNGYTATCKITILTKTVEVTGIKVDKTSLTLENGDKAIINGIISPSNATDKKISWTSSNTNVVIVDQNGNVTTKGVGTATITAKSSNGLTANCSVTVKEKTIEVTKVSLDKTSISMQVGDKAILKATISPTNATNKKLTWTSNNTNVVIVDQNGNVTAKGVGNTTIKVTIAGKEAMCNINVIDNSIALVEDVVSVRQGSTVKLSLKPDDSGATWTSNKASVASVDNNGNVKGGEIGTAIITVKTSSGKVLTASVIVIGTNSKIVSSYNSSTLKYWIQNIQPSSGSRYAVTHIWVKDAYNQLKVAHPFKVMHPTKIMEEEIVKNGYQNKGLIATNASVSSTKGYPVLNFVIDNDKVITNGGLEMYKIYGLNKKNELLEYAANNQGKEKAINEGVKYTFGFYPVLVKNRVYQEKNVTSINDDTFTGNNIRQAVCQVDKNNYLLITSNGFSSDRGARKKYGISLENLAKMMINYNCVMGYNLDGGTSTFYTYKGSNSSLIKLPTVFNKNMRADLLYFVEK